MDAIQYGAVTVRRAIFKLKNGSRTLLSAKSRRYLNHLLVKLLHTYILHHVREGLDYPEYDEKGNEYCHT
jgi:hypothetical protein